MTQQNPMRLLCTDLDRTLIPNGRATESPHARTALKALVDKAPLSLAYVSGRSLTLVLEAISNYDLPIPDVIAADVGSSVHHRDGQGWRTDVQWETTVADHWHGERQERIGELLACVSGLEPQAGTRQMPFKRSYVLAPGARREDLEREVRAPLEADGIRAALVFSQDDDAGLELLDVLPAGGTKLHAVRYIRDILGAQNSSTVFSGDSGNDLDVLISEVPSVLVANGDDATRQSALAAVRGTLQEQHLYVAQGGLEAGRFGTLNGCYAAGIVEGLLHFHPDLATHLY